MDDRIAASSTACYITTFEKLFEYIGPQDAEQVPAVGCVVRVVASWSQWWHADGSQIWPSGLTNGLDLPDLVEARAPKATQLLFTTDDQIFPISVRAWLWVDGL